MTASYLNVMFSDFSPREIGIANALLSGISNKKSFFQCPFDTMEQATLLIVSSSEASNFLTMGPTGSYYSDETIAECASVWERLIHKGLDPAKHNQNLMKEVKKGLVIPGKNLFSWLSEQLQKELFFFLSAFYNHGYEDLTWKTLKEEVREIRRINEYADHLVVNRYGYADRDLGNIFTQMGIFVYVPETESYSLFGSAEELNDAGIQNAFKDRMDEWISIYKDALKISKADQERETRDRLCALGFTFDQCNTAKKADRREIVEGIFGNPIDGVGVKITDLRTGREYAALYGLGYFEIEPAKPLYSPLPVFLSALND